MKVIGVVQWTNRDKNNTPIAGVLPLVENRKGEWRTIDSAEEFPSQGQVFWFAAHNAVERALVQFRAKPNPGQKDEYQVDAPELLWEVLDLRRFGSPTDVRAALIAGLARISGPVGSVRALVLCKPDALVGPVDLTRGYDNAVKLSGTSQPRVPLYTGASIRPLSINDHEQRLIRIDESAPSGYVDWDDDATVLKRAIEVAVRVARSEGRDTGQTRRQIEDAARALASQGIGPDAQLDRYRLERALGLLVDTGVVGELAAEIAGTLLAYPAIQAALDDERAKVRSDIERVVRAEVEQQLDREREALKATTDAQTRAKAELETATQALLGAEERLRQARDDADSVAREAEAAVDERVRAALDRPLDLLAQVSVLRPLLGGAGPLPLTTGSAGTSRPIDWSRTHGQGIKDKASLRQILTGAARARGIDPSLMLQLHAATAACLMPVTFGGGALAALAAYADGVCGGRLLIIHVSPSAIRPTDLNEGLGGGLVGATAATRDIDGISLVVLEGANRSPLEASVVPLLQLTEVGLSPLSSARGVRLAASLVAGATTVPVTPQLWGHAAAIYSEPTTPSGHTAARGDIALSSELLALGDEPTEVVDTLIDSWPDCRALRPAMIRFGAALNRFYDDESRLTEALLNGLVLPYIATALKAEEEAEALRRAGQVDESVAPILRRLRRSLS